MTLVPAAGDTPETATGVARDVADPGSDAYVVAAAGAGQPSRDEGGLAWVPVQACTLPTAERPLRVAEFADLFAAAVRGVQRPAPTRLRLTIDAAAQERARELAARESSCCSFFRFTFTGAGDGTVWLDVEVPAVHVEVLDGLAAQAARASGVGQ